MNIIILGAGYVGLVTGACIAEFGRNVTCVDPDGAKVARLRNGDIPIYEPGLDEIVARNVAAGRLRFATQLDEAEVRRADAVFIAVGTPSRRGDGHADLTYVHQAARDIAPLLPADKFTVIVTKSTVPVGTGREVAAIIESENPDADFAICANPEFLREGAAVNDFMRPDRIIIGCDDKRVEQVMRELYRPLYLRETPLLCMSPESAELAKYAANAFLATKIGFINEIADLCEKVGADVHQIAKSMGMDGRISPKFLHAGPGFGGSCFPKDLQALVKTGEAYGATPAIAAAVAASNEKRKKSMASRVIAACGGDVCGKTVAIFGVTFKPDTDDMRDSPALDMIPALLQAGAQVRAYDPVGMIPAARLLHGVQWSENPYEAAADAAAAVILTEWNEFRALDLERLREIMQNPLLIDLRNIYKPAEAAKAGFRYFSIGRPCPSIFSSPAAPAISAVTPLTPFRKQASRRS